MSNKASLRRHVRHAVTFVTASPDWSQIFYQFALGVAALKVLSEL